MSRGDSAEWCPKCKVNVMPVGRAGKTKTAKQHVIAGWMCPVCRTDTVPA